MKYIHVCIERVLISGVVLYAYASLHIAIVERTIEIALIKGAVIINFQG